MNVRLRSLVPYAGVWLCLKNYFSGRGFVGKVAFCALVIWTGTKLSYFGIVDDCQSGLCDPICAKYDKPRCCVFVDPVGVLCW